MKGWELAELNTITSVLYVDDDPNIRIVAEISLESQFTVLLADSGARALEIAKREKPDLILLDVRMPGMDGPTTLAKLREDPVTEGIPVIIMSASVQIQELEEYRSLDVIDVIPKPFDPIELPEQIRKAVIGARVGKLR